MERSSHAVRLRRATWWCRTTGTAALVSCAVTTLELLFPAPESAVLRDRAVGWAALTALLTLLWWVGASLAPPLPPGAGRLRPGPRPRPAAAAPLDAGDAFALAVPGRAPARRGPDDRCPRRPARTGHDGVHRSRRGRLTGPAAALARRPGRWRRQRRPARRAPGHRLRDPPTPAGSGWDRPCGPVSPRGAGAPRADWSCRPTTRRSRFGPPTRRARSSHGSTWSRPASCEAGKDGCAGPNRGGHGARRRTRSVPLWSRTTVLWSGVPPIAAWPRPHGHRGGPSPRKPAGCAGPRAPACTAPMCTDTGRPWPP